MNVDSVTSLPLTVLLAFGAIALFVVTLMFFLRESLRDRGKRKRQTAEGFFQPGRNPNPPPLPDRQGRPVRQQSRHRG